MIAGLISLLLLLMGNGRAAASQVELRVFDHGKRLAVAGDSPAARELVSRCEEQLRMADTVLRLAVSPSLLQNLREQELVVEILYAEPRTLARDHPGHTTLRVGRLLIPLTGDLSGEITTIFQGESRYLSGPYRNRQGTAELKELVDKLGARIKDRP